MQVALSWLGVPSPQTEAGLTPVIWWGFKISIFLWVPSQREFCSSPKLIEFNPIPLQHQLECTNWHRRFSIPTWTLTLVTLHPSMQGQDRGIGHLNPLSKLNRPVLCQLSQVGSFLGLSALPQTHWSSMESSTTYVWPTHLLLSTIEVYCCPNSFFIKTPQFEVILKGIAWISRKAE